MSREDQVRFVNELVDNVKADLLKNVSRVPENWDGIELRQWIADRFADAAISKMLTGSRRRTYKNSVLVENL